MFTDTPVVLFDGVCNLCNGTVNFLIRHNKKRNLRFAALQSVAGQTLLAKHGLPQESVATFFFFDHGKIYNRSSAALKVASHLSWYWQWTQVFWLVPIVLRDGIYNLVAKNRYRWFGKKAQCTVPSPEVRTRFLI